MCAPLPIAALPAGSASILAIAAAGLGLLFLGLLFLGLWWLHLRLRNAALVDVGWAGALGLLALVHALAGDAPAWRRALLVAVAGGWSVRLAVHLLRDRILTGVEEGRYQALRAWLGPRANAWLLPFFLAQALLAAGLSLPFLLVAGHTAAALHPLEACGAALAVLAVWGERVADRQLAAFKAGAGSAGTVCRRGLWAWSRHPNYFFEWLVWCGFALMATPAPGGGWAWSAPLVMFLLIRHVTGIPPTERRAVRSRGDAYRRYQAEVSPLIPWPPRTRGGGR